MTMAYQPTEEEIRSFMAVVPGIERREAIARIKVNRLHWLFRTLWLTEQGNNNNVEYAINEYYEDPGSSTKVCWDLAKEARIKELILS